MSNTERFVPVAQHTNTEDETVAIGFPSAGAFKGQEILFLLDDGVTSINANHGAALMLADAGTQDWLHRWTLSRKMNPELTKAVVALMDADQDLPGVAEVVAYFKESSSLNWETAKRFYGASK